MGMVMTNGGRAGRLLLLVALLFGIATMHTVGHPTQPDGPSYAASSAGHPADGDPQSPDGHHPGRLTGVPSAEAPGAPRAQHSAPASDGASHSSLAPAGADLTSVVLAGASLTGAEGEAAPDHGPGGPASGHGAHGDDHGMDPSMVCLAVLGAWGIVLVLSGGWWWGGQGARPPTRGAGVRIRRTLRPNPPPPRTLLAQLSVLRT